MSCCDSVAEKTPDKGNFREKEFAPSHSSKAPSIMVGTAKQQECEVAGHSTSRVRNTGMHACGRSAPSLHLYRPGSIA